MRKKYNGFVKFVSKVEGKEVTPVRNFTYKEEWPGECCPDRFKALIKLITEEYDVGCTLDSFAQHLLDMAIVWDTHSCEMEFSGLHSGEPLSRGIMDLFENWAWRLSNGEEPDEYNENDYCF